MPQALMTRATALSVRVKDLVCLLLLTLALLLPFVGKPLHIDDPMYVWTAKHIAEDPVDFYGLSVNWFGSTESMATAQQNPPGVAYWLALVGALFGWSESALHMGMLVPAFLAVIGVWLLAQSLGAPPMLAGLSFLAMPGFLVSSTTLMADVLAMALWTWAVLAWVVGLQERRSGWLAAGAILVSLCILTKYVGAALIPLLLAYTWSRHRRLEVRSLLLLVPVAVTLAYRARMISRYGVDPLAVVAYSQGVPRPESISIERPWIGLIFLGGTCLPTLLFSGWIFGRRVFALSIVFVFLSAAALLWLQRLGGYPLRTPEGPRWSLVMQLTLFTLSGLLVYALIIQHMWRHRSAEAILLALWVCGIFVFGSFLNWTINVRTLLPAAPAVAVLLAAEARVPRAYAFGTSPGLLAMLGISTLAGLLVAQGDQSLSKSARNAAREIARAHLRNGQQLWYQGAWGFQFYMDLEGARKIDWTHVEVSPGDELMQADSNGGRFQLLPPGSAPVIERYRLAIPALASTMSGGAGFYSDSFGPAPYVFGPPSDQQYFICALQTRLSVRGGWIYPDPVVR